MKNLKTIALILVAFFLVSNTYSQRPGEIQIGASIPYVEFADYSTENPMGGATTGYSIGVHYTMYKFPKTGLEVSWGFDINYNTLQKDYRDDIEFRVSPLTLKTTITKYSQYMNLPITLGLKYTLSGNHIGVFANAGASVNTLKITDMEGELDNFTLVQQMALAHGFGYKIGGGLLVNKRVTCSVEYISLGEHNIENHVYIKQKYGTHQNDNFKLKVDMLMVRLGYKFNQVKNKTTATIPVI